MVSYKAIYKNIESLTTQLIGCGLSVQQNYPSCHQTGAKDYEISYSKMQDISIALRNIPYDKIYQKLDQDENYNIKMIDGGLIQLFYIYKNAKIASHRLAFFPSPFLKSFQNEPELYEEDEIYADILDKNISPVPIRFDYDPDNFEDMEHPRCHLTLGQFKNCRIPVFAPLTPSIFIAFILRNFYNTAFRKFTQSLKFNSFTFPETITEQEKKILHISLLQ